MPLASVAWDSHGDPANEEFPDFSARDCRIAWNPTKVVAIFDPVAQCEPSENLYSFCFTDHDQRWIQMAELDVDHTALHERHPEMKEYMRIKKKQWPFVALNVPKPTNKVMKVDFSEKFPVTVILEQPRTARQWDNIGDNVDPRSLTRKAPHWQLWNGTKNAIKDWHMLQDCQIKTVFNTMDYSFNKCFEFQEHEHLQTNVNGLINGIF